jgi:O-antigen ligase
LSPGADALRRFLLGIVTALVVARPLILGEDPGLVYAPMDTGNIILTFLWFVTAVGYAAWCAAFARPLGRPNLVEVALVAVVVCVFISAERAASYHHPARLIAWDWLSYVVAFALVRRLARAPAERAGLVAVLLASAVALSGYALYQAAVELPENRVRFGESAEDLRRALAQMGQHVESDSPALARFQQRILDNHVYGTYSHPNSFAGYLSLLIPAFVGAAWVSGRGGGPWWRTALLAGCALLGGAAVWLTHSRGALISLALVAVGTFALGQRRRLAGVAVVLVGTAILAGAGFLAARGGLFTSAFGKEGGGLRVRLDYWKATGQMIGARPWWGFGPGNFGNAYLRYMEPTAAEQIKDPHNFAMEVWASSGLFALAALLAGLTVFGYRVVRGAQLAECERPNDHGGTPWEFYLGGMGGLLLGFVLRASDLPADAIRHEALAAGGRSILWFAAFALFERLPWTRSSLMVVLAAGIAALWLNLCLSGGVAFPAVAGMLWVVMGLALAGDAPAEVPVRRGSVRWAALLVVAAVCLFFFLNAFYPVTRSAGFARRALAAAADPVFEADPVTDLSEEEKRQRLRRQYAILMQQIIPGLKAATAEDRDNAWLWLQLSLYHSRFWQLDVSNRDAARAARLPRRWPNGSTRKARSRRWHAITYLCSSA